MASIDLEGVSKVYGDGTVAVERLDLHVADGEFAVLVGPSGSGKSTALRMVAGLEDATSGTIRIGQRDVTDLAPRERDVAMVFQSYALYPHMNVEGNMAFGLRRRGADASTATRLVARAARRLGIDELLSRRPRHLSGGQRQRVALGRAIVREPEAFLMDEPLSNLDAKLRVAMRAYLAQLHHELGGTTLYVTHDQTEAMTLADRVAIMRDGRLEQVDTPQAVFDRPANVFVAGFMGSPAMNLEPARIDAHDGRLWAVLGDQRIAIGDRVVDERPALREHVGGSVVLGVRPEAFTLAENGGDEDVLHARVTLREALGAHVLVHLDGPAPLVARLPGSTHLQPGDRARLRVDSDALHVFDAESGRAL